MSKVPAQTAPTEQYVTVKFLAARYRTSTGTIWRWVRNQDFPAPVSLTPGTTRWRMSIVERFERERATEQQAG